MKHKHYTHNAIKKEEYSCKKGSTSTPFWYVTIITSSLPQKMSQITHIPSKASYIF